MVLSRAKGAGWAERSRSLAPRTALVLIAALVVAGALSTADGLLVRLDRSERQRAAAELFSRGQALTAQHKDVEALQYYRMAFNERRDDPEYRLALVRALMEARRLGDAEAEAQRLLESQPNAGPANIALGRILAAESRYDDAAWYYHRGLYGNWPRGREDQRLAVRLELANMLVDQKANEQAAGEAILLLNEAGANGDIRRKSADLLAKAGAFERAAEVFRELLRVHPQDASLHVSLGSALLKLGQFRGARNELASAAGLGVPDAELHRKLTVAQTAVELDSLAHGIGSGERTRRARAFLQSVINLSEDCGSRPDAQVKALLDPRSRVSEFEEYLGAAREIWEHLQQSCKTSLKAEAISALLARS